MSIICDTITWVDADGAELILSSSIDMAVLDGASGRGLPPIVVSEETVPLQPGSRLRYLNHGARDYAVPWVVWAETYADLNAALRAYLPRLDPLRGDGVLRIDTPDGLQRELTCRYLTGAERDQAMPQQGMSESEHLAHQVLQPVFRAFDPYWYGPEVSESFTLGTVTGTFFPIPNPTTGSFITLVASEVFAIATLTNDGDVDAMPVWTITGPAINPVLRNTDTGALLAFSGLTLAAGEVAVIDTRRYVMTAELDDGTNLYPYLTDAGTDFWWLARGDNHVQIEFTGATGDSIVEVAWRPAYVTV